MTKGTPSMGKHQTGTHVQCRRCGSHSFHAADKRCSSCHFGASAKRRNYSWSKGRH